MTLNCDCSMRQFRPVGAIYTCFVRFVVYNGDDNDTTVENVTHNHLSDYSNDQIEGLYFYQHYMPSLSKGISRFFPNLKFLDVDSSELKTISKDDLKPFTNLMYLVLFNNHLVSLDGDLFVENPRIELINFSVNQIKNVGAGLLDPLTKLTEARFNGNPCIDTQSLTASGIDSLKQELAEKCPEAQK